MWGRGSGYLHGWQSKFEKTLELKATRVGCVWIEPHVYQTWIELNNIVPNHNDKKKRDRPPFFLLQIKIDHLALPSGKMTDITHGLNGPRAATTTRGENCRKRYTKKVAQPARPNDKLFHSPTRIIPTCMGRVRTHARTRIQLTWRVYSVDKDRSRLIRLLDDAVAVGESRPPSSPSRLLLVSSARDSEREQPSSSSSEPADDEQGSPTCWATAALLGGVSRPRGRRRAASAELRWWVRAVPTICVQTITSLELDKVTIFVDAIN